MKISKTQSAILEKVKRTIEVLSKYKNFTLLNGDWDFRYYDSVYDVREEFYREENTSGPDWKKIPVPSVWQNHGYDRHQYTNINYPFPLDPPYVPYVPACRAPVLPPASFCLLVAFGNIYHAFSLPCQQIVLSITHPFSGKFLFHIPCLSSSFP